MLSYDYSGIREYCDSLGLVYFGDEYVERHIGEVAKANNFTQQQVDIAMRLHLWQVCGLFDAKSYSYIQRVLFALYFLTGFRGWKNRKK